MQIVSGTVPRALRLADLGRELSPDARRRLKWMDYYESHGENARLTCRHFDISPQTFYRWRRRYSPRRLTSLEDRSRCPHRVRRPTWTPELVEAVRQLREQYPRWGKDKLTPLLRAAGWSVSTSMVGRILGDLRKRDILVEPPSLRLSVRRPRPPRPYAIRKPQEYQAKKPGDTVQVDTLDLRPLPGVVLKHFTARDVVSRWDVLEVRSRATASTAAAFLDAILARSPFPVRAIQVDGGNTTTTLCWPHQALGYRMPQQFPRGPRRAAKT